jgi:hypothetical protein
MIVLDTGYRFRDSFCGHGFNYILQARTIPLQKAAAGLQVGPGLTAIARSV